MSCDNALLELMKCGCYCSRSDSQTEAAVVVQYEVLDLAWNVVSVKQGFHQLVWNGPVGAGKVEPKDCQVSFDLPCLSDRLGDNSCMLNASWDL